MVMGTQRQLVRGAWPRRPQLRSDRRHVSRPLVPPSLNRALRVGNRGDLIPIVGERIVVARARPPQQDTAATLVARLKGQRGALKADLCADLRAHPGPLWDRTLSDIYVSALAKRVQQVANGGGPALTSWLRTLQTAGRLLHPDFDARVRTLGKSLPSASCDWYMREWRSELGKLTAQLANSSAWRADTASWLRRIAAALP